MLHGRPDYNRRIVDLENLIPEDEPVFLIRGRDKVAAIALRAYGQAHAAAGGDPRVSQRAYDQAEAIEAYQRTHPSRLAN
jgi:hypothetical protein